MTKGDENLTDNLFFTIDANPFFWEVSGNLYFWDIDKTCYKWSGEETYWVASTMFDYNSYWYEGIAPDTEVTDENAKLRFPGAVPIVILTNKKKSAKRKRIIREYRRENTDSQVFEDPVRMPRGYGFTGTPHSRRFTQKGDPDAHPTASVYFSPGPIYYASYQTEVLAGGPRGEKWDVRRFDNKNEAQIWAIAGLRKLVKAERAAAKALKTEKEGENNERTY
jgi:hypothetical protein